MGKVKCKDKVSIKKNLLLGIFYHLYLSYKEDKMNVNIYDFLMTTLTGCSQIHFGKGAVTIGNVKKEKSTKAKIKKAQSSSKKTAPKKKKVVKKESH